jgi:ATP-dependent Lhr-like helicase
MRDVLLGTDAPVSLTSRASGALAGLRSDAVDLASQQHRVWPGGSVISRGEDDLRWWTWAGYKANATLKATLGSLADETQRVDDLSIRLRTDLDPSSWGKVIASLRERLCLPEVDEKALAGLKFSEALPRRLAEATLAARLADLDHAGSVLAERHRFER